MKLPEGWQQEIEDACRRFMDGDREFRAPGTEDGFEIWAENNRVFVIVPDRPKSDAVGEVLNYAGTLGHADQLSGGMFSTTIRILPT